MAESRRDRGLALVMVLWVLALMAVLGTSVALSGRTDLQLARNLADGARTEALADAGLYRAVLGLLDEDPAAAWSADGRLYTLEFGGGNVDIRIVAESGKVSLNFAEDALIRNLMVVLEVPDDEAARLVDALVDFRDPDDLVRLNGAERKDYLAAGLAYGPKNAPLEAIEELSRVLGVTPELYHRLRPFVTAVSNNRGVDIARAPREVLLAMPTVDPAEVERVIADREAPPTLDEDQVLAPVVQPIGGEEPVTIRAEAHLGDAVFVREALLELTGDPAQPVRIFSWQRGRDLAQGPKEKEENQE